MQFVLVLTDLIKKTIFLKKNPFFLKMSVSENPKEDPSRLQIFFQADNMKVAQCLEKRMFFVII